MQGDAAGSWRLPPSAAGFVFAFSIPVAFVLQMVEALWGLLRTGLGVE